MINNIESHAAPLPVTPVSAIKAVATPDIDEPAEVSAPSPDTTNISILSRQLSESAARAEVRDQSLSRQALGDLALRFQAHFGSVPYDRSDAMSVLPDATINDPFLRERDRQAVEYVIRDMQRDPCARNPFAGLSYEQLTVIAYDESDTFTLHERHAAYRGACHIELEWGMDIYGRSQQGDFIQDPHLFYAEHLIYYRSLPPIKQAQSPADYEAKVEGWMLEAAAGPKKDERLLTLFEILAGAIPGKDDKEKEKTLDAKEADTPAASGPGIKTSSLSPGAFPTPGGAARS
ncbi:hypothetical protein PSCICO_19240 [Pseudomonas cichorii]|uniref:hypothetical protein n=1 Tax=Pseudomonas cichorii TaxID=36746 RepID=UPI00190FC88C|nr:hypothetical protein [Pseudomonas cichorii]GFM86525.1 hypothetical protein PSCICO_19240 [Pseudomonas cichorii]